MPGLAPSHPLPRIVYITSRGHSGSTITELLIGAHSKVLAAGELKEIWRQRRPQRCRCGIQPAVTCPFWRHVDTWLRLAGEPALLELRLEDEDDEIFERHNRALFAALRAVSGADYVVDASKNMDRLERLLGCGAFDIDVVYLQRSPIGVAYSNVRRGRDLADYARQITIGTMKARERLATVPHVRLQYESLTSHPARELRRVMAAIGLAFEPDQLRWAEHPGHSIAGNKSRFAKDSTLRQDRSWRRGLQPGQLVRIAWLTLPTRFRSPWLYEAHLPYWKGEGLEAWREHRRRWKERARRRRRHRLMRRFPVLRPLFGGIKAGWNRIRRIQPGRSGP